MTGLSINLQNIQQQQSFVIGYNIAVYVMTCVCQIILFTVCPWCTIAPSWVVGALVCWQSVGLVIDRTWVQLSPGPLQTTSNKLLIYCVLRPTQPPTLTGMRNEQQLSSPGVGYGMKAQCGLIGVVVCLLAAPPIHLSISACNGWLHNALRYHQLMPISCHFRYYKVLLFLSLTHVSSAIASVVTFNLSHFGGVLCSE